MNTGIFLISLWCVVSQIAAAEKPSENVRIGLGEGLARTERRWVVQWMEVPRDTGIDGFFKIIGGVPNGIVDFIAVRAAPPYVLVLSRDGRKTNLVTIEEGGRTTKLAEIPGGALLSGDVLRLTPTEPGIEKARKSVKQEEATKSVTEEESAKQAEANKRITDKIRQIYQKARQEPEKMNPGVCDDVILAVRMGAIGTGTTIRDLESIFGAESLIWGKEKTGGAVAVIPLDFPLPPAKGERDHLDLSPKTAQSGQMHLFVRSSKDMDVADLYFRYGALSGFTARDLLK